LGSPPAIVSMFVGDELEEILESIESDTVHHSRGRTPFKVNDHTIPSFPKDNTDRNRTSPFAFTGNKFEFRMPGSSASIATPNTILNTVIAQELKGFADRLESSENFPDDLHKLIRDTIRDHRRIIFNGNGYDDSWVEEAARRGLSNYRSTPEALAHYLDEKNVRVMVDNGVLTEAECRSRHEIYLEKYYKTIRIEARTLLDMTDKDILPAVNRYLSELRKGLETDMKLEVLDRESYSWKTSKELSRLCRDTFTLSRQLKEKLSQQPAEDSLKTAMYCHDEILPLMEQMRSEIDRAEVITDRSYWPMPSYRELLFGVD
ncbi:MAG: glutamine synthetase type III, partial [Erysipelotrichaceae bacterium]|nr:glutamine synthetase type III [Erysipelotrichaceae bacterium]